MDGPAGASTELQLIPQPSSTPSDATGTGSTAVSDSQSSIQDSQSPIDQSLSFADPTLIFPTEGWNSDSSDIPTVSSQTGEEVTWTAEAVGDGQDKGGGGAEMQNVASDSLVIKEEGEVLLGHVNGQIELLEHTPEHGASQGMNNFIVSEEGQDWIPNQDHELKRVKVRKFSYYSTVHLLFIFLSPLFICMSTEIEHARLPDRHNTSYHCLSYFWKCSHITVGI